MEELKYYYATNCYKKTAAHFKITVGEAKSIVFAQRVSVKKQNK